MWTVGSDRFGTLTPFQLLFVQIHLGNGAYLYEGMGIDLFSASKIVILSGCQHALDSSVNAPFRVQLTKTRYEARTETLAFPGGQLVSITAPFLNFELEGREYSKPMESNLRGNNHVMRQAVFSRTGGKSLKGVPV